MNFNNLQALATAAIYATTGKASDIRAAAFEGRTRQLLKTDGIEGKALGSSVYSQDETLTVDIPYGECIFTIQQNTTQGTYTIVNITEA